MRDKRGTLSTQTKLLIRTLLAEVVGTFLITLVARSPTELSGLGYALILGLMYWIFQGDGLFSPSIIVMGQILRVIDDQRQVGTRVLSGLLAIFGQAVAMEAGALWAALIFPEKTLDQTPIPYFQSYVVHVFVAVVILTGLRRYEQDRSQDTWGLAIACGCLGFGRISTPTFSDVYRGQTSLEALVSFHSMAFTAASHGLTLVLLVEKYLTESKFDWLLAEFLGVFFLFVVANGSISTPLKGAPALVLAAMIFTYGPVSHAYFNVAGCWADFLLGRLNFLTFLSYLRAHFFGAFFAFLFGLGVRFPESSEVTPIHAFEIFTFELLGTGLLVTAVSLCGTGPRALSQLAALAIGWALYVGAPLWGQQVNPTFTIFWGARALLETRSLWVVYELGVRLVGQLVGTFLGAGLVYLVDTLQTDQETPEKPRLSMKDSVDLELCTQDSA